MSNTQNINPKQTLAVNGEAVPLAEFNQDTFLQSNKKLQPITERHLHRQSGRQVLLQK